MHERESENTWGNRLLRLTMNSTMIQWLTENTRYREDKSSRLDLFTKGINLFPFGNSDFVVLEIEMKGGSVEIKQEQSYNYIRNYTRCSRKKTKFLDL